MSIVRSNTYQDATGGSNATFSGVASPPNGMGFRNRVINGNMVIDQRNSGAAVTTDGGFPVDRFRFFFGNDGAYSAQRSTTAPAGFVNSIQFTTTTADASLGSTQQMVLNQQIEGTNIADLAWGTASASTVTLSFWTRSSLTGTFGGSLRNNNNNRSYPFTYAINAANTWEYKTITIAGDTTGTWETSTSATGIGICFGLGVGSSLSGTAGSWSGSNFTSATGAVSVIGTLNATWFVTGVQLEAGTVASPFERRDYGRELMMCQRYFVKDLQDGTAATFLIGVVGSATVADRCGMRFPVNMRATPTAAIGGTANPRIYDGATAPSITSISQNTSSSFGACLGLTASGGGLTVGRAAIIMDGTASFITYSSEL